MTKKQRLAEIEDLLAKAKKLLGDDTGEDDDEGDGADEKTRDEQGDEEGTLETAMQGSGDSPIDGFDFAGLVEDLMREAEEGADHNPLTDEQIAEERERRKKTGITMRPPVKKITATNKKGR